MDTYQLMIEKKCLRGSRQLKKYFQQLTKDWKMLFDLSGDNERGFYYPSKNPTVWQFNPTTLRAGWKVVTFEEACNTMQYDIY